MIARLVSVVAAALLVSGCSTGEGVRAQELLKQAEAAQAELRSATFDGSMVVSVDGLKVRALFNGAMSKRGTWFSLRTSGIPDGGDVAMQALVRGGRTWLNMGDRWRSVPTPTGAGSTDAMSAAAFQQLARHVKDVRVTEHQLIQGKPVTTIAGEIDTQGLLEAFAKLGSLGQAGSFDLSKLGLEIGDIRAVLTIDERTHLLDTAFVSLAITAEDKTVDIDLRYRLASANEPVELPAVGG